MASEKGSGFGIWGSGFAEASSGSLFSEPLIPNPVAFLATCHAPLATTQLKMPLTAGKEVLNRAAPKAGAGNVVESPALDWLWKYLADVPHPLILDCGPVKPQTVDVLLRRGAKVYVADLVSPMQREEPKLWDRSKKIPVFRVEEYLAQMPAIPPASINVIFGWHLLDLLPREALRAVVERLFPCLQLGGVFFCLLREAYLKNGADQVWWLESLTSLAAGDGDRPFPYSAVSGRDVERLLSEVSLKSFLSRSGRREVLVLK